VNIIAANDLAATLLLVTTYEYRSLGGYQRKDNEIMLPHNATQKGRLLENYVAQEIRKKRLDTQAMRQIGSGSGQWKGDVNTKMKILNRQAVIECKNQKVVKVQEWWIQTEKQTLGYGEPVLVIKLYNQPLESSKVVIYLDTFLELVKRASEPKMKEPDNEMKWKLSNLEKAVKALQRELK